MGNDVVVLRWVGDVDLATISPTRAAIEAALDRPDLRRLVIDLSELGFVDSLGIGLLLHAHNQARLRDVSVALRGVPTRTAHLLAVAGLDTVFAEDDTVSAADETASADDDTASGRDT